MNRYIIIGAGISGLTAGYSLAAQGNKVAVVEQAGIFGGKVLGYCCKATDSCSKCGVCVAHTKIAEAVAHKNLTLHTAVSISGVSNSGRQVSLKGVRKNPFIHYTACIGCDRCVEACPEDCISRYDRGEVIQYAVDHSRCLLHTGEACTACVSACPVSAVEAEKPLTPLTVSGSAVLVAAGHAPFDPTVKPRYGYGRSNNVISGAEAEDHLSREMYFSGAEGEPVRSIAFIQCVGSRDPVLGRNYCSSVCCAYALRLAKVLKYRNSETDVTVYYIDLQDFDKTFTPFRQELAALGVHLSRGIPFRVDEQADGRVRLSVTDSNGNDTIVEHDKVILSVGMVPAETSGSLSEQFDLSSDEFGFLRSNHPNVFVSGTCASPQSIPQSMTAAEAVAQEMGENR